MLMTAPASGHLLGLMVGFGNRAMLRIGLSMTAC
jgi:hypothetical protein